jgi:hypothetical protein
MQDLINLSNFSLVEWTALFYVFVISKFIKQMNEHEYGGMGLWISTSRFSGDDRWDVFFKSFFFLGYFFAFLFFMLFMAYIATILIIPHWLISDYFGYKYELTKISIYAGFIWAAASITNAASRAVERSQEEAIFWKQKAINLEDQIKSDVILK